MVVYNILLWSGVWINDMEEYRKTETEEKKKDKRQEFEERKEEKRQAFEERKEEKRQEFEKHVEEKKQIYEEKKKDVQAKRNRLHDYFRSVFYMRDETMMSYEDIDDMMHEQTVIHGANMWILMLAILIASIGLNVNSTAVIIGAMLISPLMSGILAMGYSLAVRDLSLLRQALVRFITQVVISLVTATIYFSISPMTNATPEMIARTSPTLYDVLIALFGGLAGMIGHTRKKHSNVIPGVAIATALMPPLCTAGYGIATRQLSFFLGAFYLFIINTMFIAISTAFITLVLRVPYHRSMSAKKQRRVNAVIFMIAVVVVIPSGYIGAKTIHDSVIDTNISKYLEDEFAFPDTQVVKTVVDREQKIISVSLIGNTLTPEMLVSLENDLSDYNLSEYKLKVTQNVLREDTENSDKVTIVVQENTIETLKQEMEEQKTEIQKLETEVAQKESQIASFQEQQAKIQDISGYAEKIYPHLSNCHVGIVYDGSKQVLLLTAEVAEEIDEYEYASIEKWLAKESGIKDTKLYLTVVEEAEQEEQ